MRKWQQTQPEFANHLKLILCFMSYEKWMHRKKKKKNIRGMLAYPALQKSPNTKIKLKITAHLDFPSVCDGSPKVVVFWFHSCN